VGATRTSLAGLSWDFVLGVALTEPYEVTPSDLWPGGPTAGVAWRRRLGDPFAPPKAGDLLPFSGGSLRMPLPAAAGAPPDGDWGNYTLWVAAPRTCGGKGWALLGEWSKLVVVSAQRVVGVRPECSPSAPALEVTVRGAAGEAVELAFAAPDGSVHTVAARIPAAGRATVRVPTADAEHVVTGAAQQQQPSSPQ